MTRKREKGGRELVMRFLSVVVSIIVMCGVAAAQETNTKRVVAVGPWEIDASFTDGRKFNWCVMTRTTPEGIEVRFTREQEGLSLTLTSPRWKLEKGVTYPVELVAGFIKLESRCCGNQ